MKVASNIAARFGNTHHEEHYSAPQLLDVFDYMVSKSGHQIDPSARQSVFTALQKKCEQNAGGAPLQVVTDLFTQAKQSLQPGQKTIQSATLQLAGLQTRQKQQAKPSKLAL